MEIERKFLVSRVPDALERYPRASMEQAYISTDPLIRIRRSGERRVLTCKGRGMLAREEFELDITEEAYARLLAKTEGIRICKDRYRIPLGGYVAELDVFAPPLAPLVLAEVEFPTEDAARAFAPPDWFGREVTYDPAYANAAMSRDGLPSETYDPDDLQSVLLYMRRTLDPNTFDSPSRVFSAFCDLSPGLKRDGNVLRQMVDAGLLRELSAVAESGDKNERRRVVTKARYWLTDYLQLSDEKAGRYVTALEVLYGLEAQAPQETTPEPSPAAPPKPSGSVTYTGRSGKLVWKLDDQGVLYVSGFGKIEDYFNSSPWQIYREKIRSVVIGRGVTHIGDNAFRECVNLTGVSLPVGVVSVGYGAFNGCSSLQSVVIPKDVRTIGAYAFKGCTNLKSVSLPKGAKVSGKAFPPHTNVTRRP